MAPDQKTNAIAAPFDNVSSANEAIERLVSVGISRTKIELLTGLMPLNSREASSTDPGVASFFFEDDESRVIPRDLLRGGHLLALSDLALDIQER